LARVPVILSNRRDMGFWRKPQHHKAYQIIKPWVDQAVVVSNAIKQEILARDEISEAKITTIYNGVKLSNLDGDQKMKVRDELNLDPADIVCVHVANFKEVKGHKYLLEAFQALVAKQYPLKLVLIGEDEFQGKFQQWTKGQGLDRRVLFLGKREDVRRLLQAADICVLPSLSEGMSNAVLEYMDASKPVVATAVGGNPETIEDGVTGYLVPPQDVTALTNALEKLIRDENLRLVMGQRGRKRAEELFSMDVMMARYHDLFERLSK
ncbi:MAG: glycosyltransferase family 4 protein, partial [Candidatus Omnitrophica bacterium]|nr:glycosyltransferase family 4 protein [Candidatus Omnitrophota bacterium]